VPLGLKAEHKKDRNMLYYFCFPPFSAESETKPANKYGSGNHWRKIEDGYNTKTKFCQNA
jgi:hypothetical protein